MHPGWQTDRFLPGPDLDSQVLRYLTHKVWRTGGQCRPLPRSYSTWHASHSTYDGQLGVCCTALGVIQKGPYPRLFAGGMLHYTIVQACISVIALVLSRELPLDSNSMGHTV